MKFFMLHIANIQKKNYRKNKKLRKLNICAIKSTKKKWNINIKNLLLIGNQDIDKLTAIKAEIKYRIISF